MIEHLYDAIIVGGGPAGLTAAIYMARARYRVLVIEKEQIGGQITITSDVVNYPGVLKTSGRELTETMRRQAENFGAEFLIAEVKDISFEDGIRSVKTSRGDYQSLGILLALGASPRPAGFRGEMEFRGRGVAYCATCDGEFFTGMDVFVVGGGFAAAEEAVFLTKYARKVIVLVRRGAFSCAQSAVDEVMNHPQIEVRFHTEVEEVGGEGQLQYAVFRNARTGAADRYEAEAGGTFGMFVFAGYAPATKWLEGRIELDEQGYLITDRDQMTSINGVYGGGDVCQKSLRQVVTAVSDGASAASSMERYISGMYEKLDLPRREIKVREAQDAQNLQNKQMDNAQNQDGITEKKSGTHHAAEAGESFISAEMAAQLQGIFAKFTAPIVLKGYLDSGRLSGEIEGFLGEMNGLTDKITVELIREQRSEVSAPSIAVCNAAGAYQRVQFHAVPGGHEFNSFVVAMYNAAGPGQALDAEVQNEIHSFEKKVDLKILVSLSCTMCPDLVMAAQRIALLNEGVDAQMYDLAHFPQIKEQYNVMSVPCLIMTDRESGAEKVSFGKKNISELLELMKSM